MGEQRVGRTEGGERGRRDRNEEVENRSEGEGQRRGTEEREGIRDLGKNNIHNGYYSRVKTRGKFDLSD